MLFFLATLVLYFAIPSHSQSFPVFGTKRYNRAVNNVQMPVPASLVPNPSYYSSAPKYYYDQMPSYAAPAYHETYPDDNPYYYYPRQEYYGMPIFHGEYKPSPYYYAHPPSYSYYDDREVATNPMDDLHEEILQEDERERQHDVYPVGQNGWYEGGGGSQQDELTNNFLKNLIAYNRQINAQEQQQQQEEQLVGNQNEGRQHQDYQNDRGNQNEGRQHQDYQNDRAPPVYEDDYADYPASSEYEYVPEDREETFSAKKYTKDDSQQRQKNSDDDDENERQLKYLAHHQKSQSDPNKQNNHKTASEWERAISSKSAKHHGQHKAAYAEEEPTPEYDDDTWINWDRKRSANNEMKIFPFLQKGDSVEVIDTRKSTAKPAVKSTTSTTTTTTTTPTKSRHSGGVFSGQKEVVLPRPAAPFPRSMFGKPLQDAAQPAVANSVPESPEKSSHSVKPSNRVYDTIKQLIAMQQKFEQNPSKLQKRFVSNEESLVHELDSLKRRSA